MDIQSNGELVIATQTLRLNWKLVFKVELIVILTLQYKYYYVMIMNSKGRLESDQHIIMIRPLVLLFTHNADDYWNRK